jgi:hypothetical protein
MKTATRINIIGKTNTQKKWIVFSLLGVLCVSIPVSIQALWIYVFNLDISQPEKTERFQSYLPEFLHGQYGINLLSLALCIAAIILSSISLRTTVKLWKFVNIFVLVLSILLLLLNLFQMM